MASGDKGGGGGGGMATTGVDWISFFNKTIFYFSHSNFSVLYEQQLEHRSQSQHRKVTWSQLLQARLRCHTFASYRWRILSTSIFFSCRKSLSSSSENTLRVIKKFTLIQFFSSSPSSLLLQKNTVLSHMSFRQDFFTAPREINRNTIRDAFSRTFGRGLRNSGCKMPAQILPFRKLYAGGTWRDRNRLRRGRQDA